MCMWKKGVQCPDSPISEPAVCADPSMCMQALMLAGQVHPTGRHTPLLQKQHPEEHLGVRAAAGL